MTIIVIKKKTVLWVQVGLARTINTNISCPLPGFFAAAVDTISVFICVHDQVPSVFTKAHNAFLRFSWSPFLLPWSQVFICF